MIDREKALKIFNTYVSKYNPEDEKIKLKIEHIQRVAKNANDIAENLKLSKEDIDLAWLIGLLHDIGRFEEAVKSDHKILLFSGYTSMFSIIEEKLKDMQANGPAPDVLTFAGNGEPTAHPHFPEIIEDTLALRDKYFPKAKVSVLSNSTFIDRPAVFEALNKIDNNMLKLDTVDEEYIHLLDRPNGKYSVKKIIERMKEFKGNCIVQTMFLKGGYQGTDMDNTSDKYVLPWIEAVKEIAPRQVMIYTIDRETPDHDLQKATHEELDRIVALLEKEGIPATASY